MTDCEIRKALNVKYDLICPLGQWCAVALFLRRAILRRHAMPFDWMFGDAVDLRGYVDIVCEDFAHFMQRENLVYSCRDGEELDVYDDLGSDMKSMHDFRHGPSFDESWSFVRAKYDRRIRKFYQSVKSSRKVLFVHLARTRLPSEEMIRESVARLRAKFPGVTIHLLALVQRDGGLDDLEMKVLDEGVWLFRGYFWDEAMDRRYGNKQLTQRIIDALRLRGRWKIRLWRLKRRLNMMARTMFHLTSDGRRQARQRLFDEQTRGGE